MTLARRIALLAALYFVQGLPFGFQATALPVLLRARGISLTRIGFSGALALPWVLKVLWAPAVDRFDRGPLGARKTWIVPLQLLLAAACAAAAVAPGLAPLLACIFLMNLFAATMDIAVDGLAVDTLAERELGWGNTAQVVGYKLGMLTGGGLLVWLSAGSGWPMLFGAMAALCLAVAALTVFGLRETARPRDAAPPGLGDIAALLARSAATPGMGWVLGAIATYKLGETLADAMFKPFLYDLGHSAAQIGLWVGTWGMALSLLGSFVGGLIAVRLPLLQALAVTATLRIVPLAAQVWLSTTTPGSGAIVAVTCAEHFCGGMLTTAMFTFMMSRVDKRIGATHFTVFATVEALGKFPPGLGAGVLADAAGYTPTFAASVGLSVLFLALLIPLRAHTPGVEEVP